MSTLMNHIHLSDTLGGSPEYSPTYKWKVRADGRAEIPVVNVEIEEGLYGDVFPHVAQRSGTPVLRRDYAYILKIQGDGINTTEELKEILISLYGKVCYLVDNYHIADDSDHTPYVQSVLFQRLGEFRSDVVNLGFYFVPIRLIGLTVTP